MDLSALNKALDGIEAKLKEHGEKADGQMAQFGKVSTDTKTAIESLGNEQKAMAERLIAIEQRGAEGGSQPGAADDWGQQFVKSSGYAGFVEGGAQKVSYQVKNTITNAIGNTFNDRIAGVVSGASRRLRLESLLTSLPTGGTSIDYVRESTFTNSAAETAEGAAKPESAITTELVSKPVSTVAHYLRISQQLAKDNAALVAYINTRLRYGVDLRVENQIIAGNGTAPNMEGLGKSGNFVAHGYSAAALSGLGLANNRFDLIGKMVGDCEANDYPADVILLNPADWWTMRLTKDSQGRYLLGDPGASVAPSLFDVPVVASNAVTADTVFVGSLSSAATFYNREGITIAMSESDADNFTKNLITLRAERRCLLAVERPAAMRFGDLTPA